VTVVVVVVVLVLVRVCGLGYATRYLSGMNHSSELKWMGRR
jgi:Tfp pilus assembly protein PilO